MGRHSYRPPSTFIIHTFIDSLIKREYIKYLDIEWDNAKRTATLEERGLDFADVALIDWVLALTIADSRSDYTETRFVTMAPINGRLCVFAWCWRGEILRVISLRKANKREQRIYDQS